MLTFSRNQTFEIAYAALHEQDFVVTGVSDMDFLVEYIMDATPGILTGNVYTKGTSTVEKLFSSKSDYEVTKDYFNNQVIVSFKRNK